MFCFISIGSVGIGLLYNSMPIGMLYFIFWSLLSPMVYAMEAVHYEVKEVKETKQVDDSSETVEPQNSAVITTKVHW